jgi:hypothetical protein
VLALYEGDWRAARELTDLGLSAQPLDPRLFGVRLVLEYSLGDYGVGRAYLGRLQEAARSAPPGPVADHIFVASLIPLVSRIACSDEGLDAAEATAEGVLSLPRIAPGLAMVAKVGKALIAVERADGEAAASLYGELEPQRGTGVFLLALAVDRLLGLLAATCDRIDPAFGHFEDGLAFCERAGYRPEYAWTAADYADALLQRGGTADRTRAVALQTEALAIARELGMRPLVERVTSR